MYIAKQLFFIMVLFFLLVIFLFCTVCFNWQVKANNKCKWHSGVCVVGPHGSHVYKCNLIREINE